MEQRILVCDCGAKFRVPASAMGKRATCPKCKSQIVISQANTRPYVPPDADAAGKKTPADASEPAGGQAAPKVKVSSSQHAPPPLPPAAPPSRPAPAPTNQAVPELPGQPGPPPVPDVPSAATAEVYPWEPSPALAAKAEAYDQQGNYRAFAGRCAEFLNTLLKLEVFRGLILSADLRVYSDLVAVYRGLEAPGCLERLLAMLPEWLRMILWPIFACIAFLVLGAEGLLGALIGIVILVIGVSVLAVLMIYFWYIMIPAFILLVAAAWLVFYLKQRRLAQIARRILADPTSPYAVRKMYQYAPLVPRFWQRGDVVQLIRVDTRRRLRRRALILVVQDKVLPSKAGCLTTGVGVYISRRLRAERRVYVLSIQGGEADADAAVQAMAAVLGVGIGRAKFRFNNLRLEKGPQVAA